MGPRLHGGECGSTSDPKNRSQLFQMSSQIVRRDDADAATGNFWVACQPTSLKEPSVTLGDDARCGLQQQGKSNEGQLSVAVAGMACPRRRACCQHKQGASPPQSHGPPERKAQSQTIGQEATEAIRSSESESPRRLATDSQRFWR